MTQEPNVAWKVKFSTHKYETAAFLLKDSGLYVSMTVAKLAAPFDIVYGKLANVAMMNLLECSARQAVGKQISFCSYDRRPPITTWDWHKPAEVSEGFFSKISF